MAYVNHKKVCNI